MGTKYKLQAFGYEAEVVPQYGMNCIRFADKAGTEVLRTPEDVEVLSEDNVFLYGGNRNFFCLEPQTWLTNCPNISEDREKDGFLIVAPGEDIILECVLQVSYLNR